MTQRRGGSAPLGSSRAIVSQIRNRRSGKQRALTFWEGWVLHHAEGRKPPIQLSSEELEQSSQEDVAEEAEGRAAVGDELCERGVGEAANSTKIRLEPSLPIVSDIRLKSSNRLGVPGAGCSSSTCTRVWKLQSIRCGGFLWGKQKNKKRPPKTKPNCKTTMC